MIAAIQFGALIGAYLITWGALIVAVILGGLWLVEQIF